jgi:hypothetical protein
VLHCGAMAEAEISLILTVLDQAFDRKSWHGTNLRGSIRGLSAAEAAWRPAPSRHNIWETVVHAVYWKYVVRRKLLSEARGSFPLEGSNWIARPGPAGADEAAWKADVRLLVDIHGSLRAAVAGFPADRLATHAAGGKETYLSLLTGVAAHDLYHAGQIQLLKRLQRS